MKTTVLIVAMLSLTASFFAQEAPKSEPEKDTTYIKLNKSTKVIVVKDQEKSDTVDASPSTEDEIEGHFSGISFGPTILMNPNFETNFPNHPQWKNDPGKSFSWDLNFYEHKFPIFHNYFGITTGAGVNITQIGMRQYQFGPNSDSALVFLDTLNSYSKNKLRGYYLTVPILLEFCSKKSGDEGFFFTAGIVGGVRFASSVKTIENTNDRDVKQKTKGSFGLNAFKADALVKFGYNNWGLYAQYGLIPLFDTNHTAQVNPLVVGLSYNF